MIARRLYLPLIIIAIVSIGVIVFLVRSCNSKRNGTPSSISIGYSRLRISLPIFVAQERNLFQKHGISADLVKYETAQPLMQALVEGKIELGGYTALPITFSAMQRSNQLLYFSTAMLEDQKHRISYLLRKKGSSIRAISDLTGKKVGILPTVAYKAWLQAILRANNVNFNSVVIQQIAPELEASTLQNGGIDALFTNDPMATAAIATGAGELVTDFVEVPKYLGEPFLFGSFNARKEWADAHPTEFAAIVAALDEAIEFINQHPDEAKQYMRNYIPDQYRDHIPLYPDALYLTSSVTTRDMFQNEADAQLKTGIITSAIDIRSLIYNAK
jgi:NitT/TauT family transport system substrate-binding protein